MSNNRPRHDWIGAVALGAALGVAGCFTTPTIDVKTISCQLPVDCPDGYVCKVPGVPGGCCKSGDPTCGVGIDGSASEAGAKSMIDGAAIDQGQALDLGLPGSSHLDALEPDSSLSFSLDGSISVPDVPLVSDAAVADLSGEDQKSISAVDLGSNLDMPLGSTSDAGNTVDSAPSVNCVGLAAGTPCGDGMVCSNGQCVACAAGSSCSVATPCHKGILSCSTGTSVCVDNGNAEEGTACGSGNVCRSGACTACVAGQACPIAGSPCRTGILTCSAGVSSCVDNGAKPDGTTCDDGNACTTGDACHGGTCTGGTQKTCTASDQCHTAGTCNASTGVCSNPAKAEGAACDDGNLCTTGDACHGGSCTSGTPKTCSASGQCYAAGTCNPSTGTCSSTPLSGVSCNDGNACTQTDTCQSGTCVGTNPVVCTALDQCHQVGTCDPGTGACSNPPLSGTSCNDGNACTSGETCQNGSCTGGTQKACTAIDQCHQAGTCDPASGNCSNPAALDGTSCSDGNSCTVGDKCQSGVCSSGPLMTCPAPDDCHVSHGCNPDTGKCWYDAVPDGSSCLYDPNTGEYATCCAGQCRYLGCS